MHLGKFCNGKEIKTIYSTYTSFISVMRTDFRLVLFGGWGGGAAVNWIRPVIKRLSFSLLSYHLFTAPTWLMVLDLCGVWRSVLRNSTAPRWNAGSASHSWARRREWARVTTSLLLHPEGVGRAGPAPPPPAPMQRFAVLPRQVSADGASAYIAYSGVEWRGDHIYRLKMERKCLFDACNNLHMQTKCVPDGGVHPLC